MSQLNKDSKSFEHTESVIEKKFQDSQTAKVHKKVS